MIFIARTLTKKRFDTNLLSPGGTTVMVLLQVTSSGSDEFSIIADVNYLNHQPQQPHSLYIQGGPKKMAQFFCISHNFTKYQPIFKFFLLSESGDNL